MSAGAVFRLIANDGKADRMIMATQLLNQRIKDVQCARAQAGRADILPTLVDIERTHILFVNAHFKPFAAIGYEYNKVQPQSGTVALGSSTTFSIPQFGDFFHDMVVYTRLSATQSSTLVAPVQGQDAAFPANAGENFYSLVDAFGNAVAGGANYQNLIRLAEFPGNRLFSRVKFDVNGNPLDEYSSNVSLMLEKFTVTPGKRAGYNRLVGQEVARQGYSGVALCPSFDADSANPPAGVVPGSFTSRQKKEFVNGNQTPSLSKAAVDIWNPLNFWFNKDVRLSIPSVSIPFGQRFITIDLAPQAEIYFESPNLFLKTVVDDAANRTVTYTPIVQAGTIADVSVEKMEMYINNIFVNPEVHDIYIKRIGFTLVRVFREHTQRVNQEGADEKQLTQLKWPIEYLMAGFVPTWNRRANNADQWKDWHRLHRSIPITCDDPDSVEVASGALAAAGVYSTSAIQPDVYYEPLPAVNHISVVSHGISIYDNFNRAFFNSYQPFHYGGPALVTPEDEGALFINFSLFPRSYQPSGHLNISRARETFIKWNTSYISAKTPSDLIAVGVAINFLLITDGSAVLRYST